ncbi:hypothetical protein CRM90_28880 [Mycobacterium sp. ENV421]|nr:hypothetical protein CRM90_28880 [Mycobacterium sp. ENV421]
MKLGFVREVPQRPQHIRHAVPALNPRVATFAQQGISESESVLCISNDLSARSDKVEALSVAEFIKG